MPVFRSGACGPRSLPSFWDSRAVHSAVLPDAGVSLFPLLLASGIPRPRSLRPARRGAPQPGPQALPSAVVLSSFRCSISFLSGTPVSHPRPLFVFLIPFTSSRMRGTGSASLSLSSDVCASSELVSVSFSLLPPRMRRTPRSLHTSDLCGPRQGRRCRLKATVSLARSR